MVPLGTTEDGRVMPGPERYPRQSGIAELIATLATLFLCNVWPHVVGGDDARVSANITLTPTRLAGLTPRGRSSVRACILLL